ncbi:MAG: hypothetical protein J6I68_01760 [Butyrivibrio sp.]|uniref:hypothetical protein n=1 Tax=Butyrivibrio sp. TaxID=28121 RepID=UPI001B2C31CE|nr:hypothetical protein [Butyrivibrio sp.]MBO5621043.1 hypothetical protein [Butyrivibrio sp.]MBP3781950.1 hypothetical protein [Butyrivibrio sp.]
MKKSFKGDFGYIRYRRQIGILRTGLFLLVVLALLFSGLFIFGSSKNYLSIIAALLCLPAGWSAVNLIMFLRAKGCSDSSFNKINKSKGGLLVRYDEVITSYDKNFNVAASTVLDKNICCYVEDDSFDLIDLEKHIKKMMAQNGYGSYSVKAFNKLDDFCLRLSQLERIRQEKKIDPQALEDAWVPGTQETAASVLLSISL